MSLVEKCAFVVHDPDVITVRQVGVEIQKLGFEAVLPSGESLKPDKKEGESIPLVKIKPPPVKNDGGSVKSRSKSSNSRSLSEKKRLMPSSGGIYQKKKEKSLRKVQPVKSEQVFVCCLFFHEIYKKILCSFAVDILTKLVI